MSYQKETLEPPKARSQCADATIRIRPSCYDYVPLLSKLISEWTWYQMYAKEGCRRDKSAFQWKNGCVEWLQYLMLHWYRSEKLMTRGVRHKNLLSISRSTVNVKPHCKVLNRIHWCKFDVATVRLLIHILGARVMNKYRHDNYALCSRWKILVWWWAFVKEWNQCQKDFQMSAHKTDFSKFMCSCAA